MFDFLRKKRRKRKRKSKNVYLGRRVRDVGKEGLDKPKEFRGIKKAILRDYKTGKISKKKARGRLLLLLRLTYIENNSKVRKISPKTRKRLREEIREAMRRL